MGCEIIYIYIYFYILIYEYSFLYDEADGSLYTVTIYIAYL